MRFTALLAVIDGTEEITVKSYNGKILYKGDKFSCPAFMASVMAIYTRNGKITIEIS